MFLLDDHPKRIENRTWRPPAHMLGQLVALHGGVTPKANDAAYLQEIREALDWVGDLFDDPDPASTLSDDDLRGSFCVTGIFAVARLQEVVTASDDPWFAGPVGWVLTDFVAVEPLIDRSPMHRGLWEIEPETLESLRQRYQLAQRKARP